MTTHRALILRMVVYIKKNNDFSQKYSTIISEWILYILSKHTVSIEKC
jgi:hypothetical protein